MVVLPHCGQTNSVYSCVNLPHDEQTFPGIEDSVINSPIKFYIIYKH
ncbi:MAG: hypothetical protein ACP5UN_01305 [Candidatus Micrarchaeia archaeon]